MESTVDLERWQPPYVLGFRSVSSSPPPSSFFYSGTVCLGFVQYLALQAYKVNYVIQIVNGEQCSSREVGTPLPLQLCPMLGFRSIPGNTGMRSLSVSCRVHSELGSDSLSHQLAEKGQDCLDEIRVRDKRGHEMRFCLRISQTFTLPTC